MHDRIIKPMNPIPLKPFSLTLEERPDYLYAYVSGKHDSYEISKQYWREISDECARIGASKVLIDEDLRDNATMADAFRLTTDILQMGFGGIKLAFVDRCSDQNDLNTFGELVAVNRGVNIKMCKGIAEVERWLLRK